MARQAFHLCPVPVRRCAVGIDPPERGRRLSHRRYTSLSSVEGSRRRGRVRHDGGAVSRLVRDRVVTEERYCTQVFANKSVTGALLRELRTAAGIGLRTMATRTTFSASYLSEVELGHKAVTDAVLHGYRKVLGDPAIGLSGVDVERLAAAVADPSGAGASSLEDIAVILERTRHLEDVSGAEFVLPVVRGLDRLARALATESAGGPAAAGLASEAAGYRAWLEHATGHVHTSNTVFGDAVRLAEFADDPSRLAHARCLRAYTARAQGDIGRALDLTAAAAAVDGAHPVLGVYARHQRAEFLAVRGDRRQAIKALTAAARASDALDGTDVHASIYWYDEPFRALHRGVVLSELGRVEDGKREALQGLEAMPPVHRSAPWLSAMLDDVESGWRP